MNRNLFRLLSSSCLLLFLLGTVPLHSVAAEQPGRNRSKLPNILLAIADDQSYPHCSAYGADVKTPAFDRVAELGTLFENGFAASPGCSPSRAALLTGRHAWELGEAGTHASSFPSDLQTYPQLLEKAGYHVGLTGKGWGPGNFKISGWQQNPAGPSYEGAKVEDSPQGISNKDYAANFAAFLDVKSGDQPFCFWYGGHEPHRGYKKIDPTDIDEPVLKVPKFLPDDPVVRADLLSYAHEIEWFDSHLGRMLDELDKRGELENTIIIVTADNGMPFPRAKANCYEYGWHVPLAIAWPAEMKGGQKTKFLASFVDFAPTILDAAGVTKPEKMTGRSLLPVLLSDEGATAKREAERAVFCSRERHSSSRYDNLGYPSRAIRTEQYLLIRNLAADRWPAGDPHRLDSEDWAYHDIDGSPTLDLLTQKPDDPATERFLQAAVAKRPAVELFDIQADPANLNNLAEDPAFGDVKQRLLKRLEQEMKQTGDPHARGNGAIFETYPRYSPIRTFPRPE